jgi:hypothetical protein
MYLLRPLLVIAVSTAPSHVMEDRPPARRLATEQAPPPRAIEPIHPLWLIFLDDPACLLLPSRQLSNSLLDVLFAHAPISHALLWLLHHGA